MGSDNKNGLSGQKSGNSNVELPCLHLFKSDRSDIGPFYDIDFILKYRGSVKECMNTLLELISPADKQGDFNPARFSKIPSEYSPGLFSLKGRLMELNMKYGNKLFLFNSPSNERLSSRIVSYFVQTFAPEEGCRILVIDGNFRAPYLHRYFRLEKKKGLTEWLGSKIKHTEIIHEALENIDVVTNGQYPGISPEHLDWQRMNDFIFAIQNEYDFIIMDSPSFRFSESTFDLCDIMHPFLLLILDGENDRWSNVQDIRNRMRILDIDVIGIQFNDDELFA